MKLIAKRCFPDAIKVIDLFHVQKLAMETLQELRINYRWEAIELENRLLYEAKKSREFIKIETFENGDTRKQLLARSSYLLYKSRDKWTLSQIQRAEILFTEYPDLKKAYELSHEFRKIYNQKISKSIAMTKLAHWFREVETSGFKSFSILRKTIMNDYSNILNFFDRRSTNA